MLKDSRTIGEGDSALHLSLYDDNGYRFLILGGAGADAEAEGAILIELNVVEELARELLVLKMLVDEPPVV